MAPALLKKNSKTKIKTKGQRGNDVEMVRRSCTSRRCRRKRRCRFTQSEGEGVFFSFVRFACGAYAGFLLRYTPTPPPPPILYLRPLSTFQFFIIITVSFLPNGTLLIAEYLLFVNKYL